MVSNFQSIHNKMKESEVFLDSINHDAIISTEAWLNDKILSIKIHPNEYNVFKRDHEDNHDGVLIAVKYELQCSLEYKSITSE